MIRINDRFSIDSYPQGWQVTETITTQARKGGEGSREVIKYYPTLRHCILYIIDQDAKQAASLEEVAERLDRIREEIDAAFSKDPA